MPTRARISNHRLKPWFHDLAKLVRVQTTAWCGAMDMQPDRDFVNLIQAPAAERIQGKDRGREFDYGPIRQ